MKRSNIKIIWRIFNLAYFAFFIGMCCAIPAYAYIDPSSTAMITQIVAGILISLGVAFSVFRRKIVLFFKNLSVKRVQRKIEKQNRKTNNDE